MGRLKRLELENFKSYFGKQIVGPFDDFTCIIGPNGAGKSNMMDAVSFVLGVQSRHLRSTNVKELIFRRDADAAPERRASVKLFYQVSANEVDNMAAGTEIQFCRMVSASGVSSYKLDDSDVTYEYYESVLSKIGVLVKARNFLVFQGDVESVASKTPSDLTKLLEQISGSDQLREEYDDLLRSRNESEENTIFMMQKKKMYMAQCKEVREQKDEAELYQVKRFELDDLKTELVLWRIWKVKMEIEEHQKNIVHFEESLVSTRANEDKIDKDVDSAKRRLAKYNKALTASEKDLGVKRKELSGIAPLLDEVNAKLRSLSKRLTEFERTEVTTRSGIVDQRSNIALIEASLADLEAEEGTVQSNMARITSSDLQLGENEVVEYRRLRELMSARTATDQAEESLLCHDIKSKTSQLQRLQGQEKLIEQEIVVEDALIAEYVERAEKQKTSSRMNSDEVNKLRADLSKRKEEERRREAELASLTVELDGIRAKLVDVGDDRRRTKQEEQIAEAIDAMKRIFPGVHGKLSDLCKPIQRKHAQAISVAAGRHMDAVVVESKQVAAECIRYLKDQRIGTCMFLPLDNLMEKPVPERLRSLGSKFHVCVDLIESDEKFKPALSYALGSALLCETLEDAQELCFARGEKVKVVTLKGHVISKSGAMTGGAFVREGGQQDRWEEKEVETLRRRKAELEEIVAELKREGEITFRQQVIDQETRLKALQMRKQLTDADEIVTREKLKELQQQCKLKEERLKGVIKETASVSAELNELEARYETCSSNLRKVEIEIFGAFSRNVGVSNIREYEENRLKELEDLASRVSDLDERRAALNAQLDYERKRDLGPILQRVQKQIDTAKIQVEEEASRKVTLQENERALLDSVDIAAAVVKSAKEERDSAASSLKTLQSVKMATSSEREAASKKLSGEEISVEKARAQLHEVLRKAQVEEVALPTVVDHVTAYNESSRSLQSDEDLRWSGSQSRSSSRFSTAPKGQSTRATRSSGFDVESDDHRETDSDLSVSSSKMISSKDGSESAHFSQADNRVIVRDKRQAAKVDLSSMRRHRNLTRTQMSVEEENLSKQISVLTAEVETMQPNMHAVERYESTLEKLKECNDELESVKNLARTNAARFEELKQQRQQLFLDCFKQVSEALGVIYRDLTKSSKHPLGGNAYLTLDNTDEPYLGGIRFTAMPPMKRFRDMDQLSGGEKTMAALALLFSIHSFRQAPFFVLDEVDAALDNVNVKKICNYMRQRSRDFQCIVISLKDMFFEHADCLVGICKDVDTLSSKILTLDLTKFDGTDTSFEDDDLGSATSLSSSARKLGTPQSRRLGIPGSRSTLGSATPTVEARVGVDASSAGRPRAGLGKRKAALQDGRGVSLSRPRRSSRKELAVLHEENEENEEEGSEDAEE